MYYSSNIQSYIVHELLYNVNFSRCLTSHLQGVPKHFWIEKTQNEQMSTYLFETRSLLQKLKVLNLFHWLIQPICIHLKYNFR